MLIIGERPAPIALIGGLIVITGVIGKEIVNRRPGSAAAVNSTREARTADQE